MIFGIYRKDGSYVGVPRKTTKLYSGDTLIMYGRADVLKELGQRRNDVSGKMAHQRAVDDQKTHDAAQEQRDKMEEAKQKGY